MKKSYETPKAEKLQFDYSEVVTASTPSGKENCLIIEMRATTTNVGEPCNAYLAGD